MEVNRWTIRFESQASRTSRSRCACCSFPDRRSSAMGASSPPERSAGEFLLTRPDGSVQTVAIKPRPLNLDAPRVQVGGEVIDVVEQLTPAQWIWCGLPALLVVTGGVIGMFVGLVAMAVSSQVR